MDTHKVRTVLQEGVPWFHAADVCKVLAIKNATVALKQASLEPEDKRSYSLGLPGKAPMFVNETGLYLLVMNSRKPSSRPFQRWVTGVVLPTLRKTGAYVMGEEKVTRPDLKVEQEGSQS
ncbi:BRO-N domain-containing protein [Methylovorus glucosotrophus]|uniref:Prophage antirepressor n=1 Tax=Methylovorus glucosotrophus (strain SIP3-4) TaxID=582744 RepID=C6XDU3_METGS|nr:BRO family protein [Methylovorus glucosotrophus]ACT50718.1 prophage antirepressor [Methylovorus glucosotrophus SIP3-4]